MSMKAKLIGNEDERAVSPVIGVILMVAITVILAAVIAAFVLDLGGSIGEEAQAGVNIDVDQNDRTIQSSWTSQGNSDEVEIQVTFLDADNADPEEYTLDASDGYLLEDPGNSVTIRYSDLEDEGGQIDGNSEVEGEVVAIARIDGGSSTVVATDNFEFDGDGS